MGILIGIYDEHQLVMDSLELMLDSNDSFEVAFTCGDKTRLLETLRAKPANILVINIHAFDTTMLNLVATLNINYSKTRVLVISANASDEMILKTIKAGAKGFLAREAGRKELVEAVLTLRNGFDYYSSSITHLLINKYITRFKSEDKMPRAEIENLSARQVEILTLWGQNYTNKEIADKLFISLRTVETHKTNIMQKLNLKTTVDMVKFAIRNNLIEI